MQLTVTTKGQVTLRKDVLRHLGIGPGDKIAVELLPDGRASIRAERKGNSFDDFVGCLKSDDKLSLEDIKRITEEAWALRR